MSALDLHPGAFGQGRDAALAGASPSDHPGGSDAEFRGWIAGYRQYQAHDPLCALCDGTGKRRPEPSRAGGYSAESIPCDCNVPADCAVLSTTRPLPADLTLVQGANAVLLEQELERELHRGQVLYGLEVVIVARGRHPDDVLVCPRTGRGPVHLVHLTWSLEDHPAWPRTETFASFDDLLSRWTPEDED